ncbi:hypothetical protein HMPREF3213_01486 [Heyndrickxia coagulans]|uniref:Uncharacterized protein n=1 Tax=Heyndrickxia coagulans TaxID=1398 RepID=A0A133KTT2_HEYCO|nr:hypothetical protein HMPREF3213_01486 [Heyndrickxia coagulans]
MHGWVITNAIFQITFFLYVNHYPSSVAFISIHFASRTSPGRLGDNTQYSKPGVHALSFNDHF